MDALAALKAEVSELRAALAGLSLTSASRNDDRTRGSTVVAGTDCASPRAPTAGSAGSSDHFDGLSGLSHEDRRAQARQRIEAMAAMLSYSTELDLEPEVRRTLVDVMDETNDEPWSRAEVRGAILALLLARAEG